MTFYYTVRICFVAWKNWENKPQQGSATENNMKLVHHIIVEA